MKYSYERRCDFHFSNDNLLNFIDEFKKLSSEKNFDFQATVFVYNFSSDNPKLLEKPESKITEEFNNYNDFSTYYFSKKHKSCIIEINKRFEYSVELNIYDKDISCTKIEINSINIIPTNHPLMSLIENEQKNNQTLKDMTTPSLDLQKKLFDSEKDITDFINIDTLKKLKKFNEDKKYIFERLIQFCDEINQNWKNKNYLSVGLLARAIMHHIPSLFGHETFEIFCNNYKFSSISIKKIIKNLHDSQKHISDLINHETAKHSNKIINEQLVDCRREVNALLQELIVENESRDK